MRLVIDPHRRPTFAALCALALVACTPAPEVRQVEAASPPPTADSLPLSDDPIPEPRYLDIGAEPPPRRDLRAELLGDLATGRYLPAIVEVLDVDDRTFAGVWMHARVLQGELAGSQIVLAAPSGVQCASSALLHAHAIAAVMLRRADIGSAAFHLGFTEGAILGPLTQVQGEGDAFALTTPWGAEPFEALAHAAAPPSVATHEERTL